MPDHCDVALTRCETYDPGQLSQALERVFSAMEFAPAPGTRILVKPNLVSARSGALACSQPEVVAAICRMLLDSGCKVTVADSPAFGTAAGVANKCGITDAIAPLGLKVKGLSHAKALPLSFGPSVGLSADACDHDLILNAPRLKAHCQMRVTGAVKNLFGCVAGMRKAIAHTRFGERDNKFEAMILDVLEALPPVVTVLDAVRCMHVTGPTGGQPYELGMIGASTSAVALDTATYLILHLTPAEVALWREAQTRGMAGALPGGITYPLDSPDDFNASGFEIPGSLIPVAFRPTRLMKSALKRLWAKLD